MRVGTLDPIVTVGQQASIFGGVGGAARPLAGEIWLVPDLIGLNKSPIALLNREAEILKVLKISRGASGGIGRQVCGSGPVRLMIKTHQQIQPALAGICDDPIRGFPIEAPPALTFD